MLSGARYFIAPKGEGLNASDPFLFHPCDEAIADTVDRLYVRRLLGFRLDLLSHTTNIYIHAPWCDGSIIAPHPVQQLIPGKNKAGMRRQMVKQSKLQRAEFDLFACNTDCMR